MNKDELRSEFNVLYEEVTTRVRQYIIENLSLDVPRFIAKYNDSRTDLDMLRSMQTDIVKYHNTVADLVMEGVSPCTHIYYVFDFYRTGKLRFNKFDDDNKRICDEFIPFFAKLDKYYRNSLARSTNPWRKFCIWVRRVLRLQNPVDNFIMSFGLRSLIQSDAYVACVSELKKECRTARNNLLGRLGEFGVIPANCTTDLNKFIKYGNVVTKLHTFPQDLQDELKVVVAKLVELKKEMG